MQRLRQREQTVVTVVGSYFLSTPAMIKQLTVFISILTRLSSVCGMSLGTRPCPYTVKKCQSHGDKMGLTEST